MIKLIKIKKTKLSDKTIKEIKTIIETKKPDDALTIVKEQSNSDLTLLVDALASLLYQQLTTKPTQQQLQYILDREKKKIS